MADFVPVFKVSDLPSGSKRSIFASGKRIMVVNADGRYYAMDNACSHSGCGLAEEGFVTGTAIMCSCHGSRFDLTSGAVLSPPASEPMATYPVKVEGENVMVAI